MAVDPTILTAQVGSESFSGAGSPVLGEALQRVSSCFAPDAPHAAAEALLVSTRRSFLLSADVAHAVRPISNPISN